MEKEKLQYPGHLWGKLAFLTQSIQEFIWEPKYSLMQTEPARAWKAAYSCRLQASPGFSAAMEDYIHKPTDNIVSCYLSHQYSLTPENDRY